MPGPPLTFDRPHVRSALCSTTVAWSVYGAERAQPLATDRKWERPNNGSNRRIRSRWQPTATVSGRMVKSMFATACHRLPTIPYLLERESTSWLRKEIESREPEGPKDSGEARRTQARL